MEALAAIAREVDSLERVQAELAGIASREDDRRRHDLVELRRKLAAQIAEVGRVAEPLFSTLDDKPTAQTYRAKFSRMRSAAAIHQASWPAVMLGERLDEYRASALGVREANRDFVAWMRETLTRLA
jgi:hypothetical protein